MFNHSFSPHRVLRASSRAISITAIVQMGKPRREAGGSVTEPISAAQASGCFTSFQKTRDPSSV